MTGAIPNRVARRALERCSPGDSDCLISDYSIGSHGYAQIGWYDGAKTQMTTAHRAAWVAITGQQIPDGMTVDHICKNRRCVNPTHLRLLSNFENARRTSGRDWPVGGCINGHPPNDWHQPVGGGRGYCLTCAHKWGAKYRQRKKQGLVGRDRPWT